MDAKTPPSPSPYSPTRRMRMRTHSFSAQNKNGEASYIPLVAEVVAMPPPGGCARGGGQWAGTHGPPRSVPARRVEEDNGTQ